MNTNLIIGSNGFIGKSLCNYLMCKNENVINFDITTNPKQDGRYRQLDLANINHVYFLAWDVGGAKYLYDKETQLTQLEWNIKLLSNLMPQLTNSKFIFVSSHLSDDTNSVYGITKKIGEMWTQLIGGINVRLWNIYGTYEKYTNKSHVVGDFIHQAILKNKINMLTNGEEKRQFIYITDLIKSLKYIIDYENINTYDITTNYWISIYEIAKIISNITGCNIQRGLQKGNEILINPKNLYDKHITTNIVDGLKQTIEIYKNE
jgi:nucleoside-diphosphate-sugar epimerase